MTRKRIILLGTLGVVTCIAVACGLLVLHARDRYGPMRTFYDLPEFERLSWMEDRHVASYERLMNDVSRKRRWSNKDAAFVMSLLRAPRLSRTVPLGFEDVDFSIFFATPEQIAALKAREGADGLIEWSFRSQEQVMAWSIVSERMRLDLDIPDDMREHVIEGWLEDLSDEDEWIRVGSTSALVYSRSIEDPAIRVRIEAMRTSDPIPIVRDNAVRQLAHYDRIYHGIEPDGPTSECNTCP